MSKPERQPVDVQNNPVLEVAPNRYQQPSKAELEADVGIDTTPERLAQALMRDVTVRTARKAR